MQFPDLATVFDAGSAQFAEWTPLLWGPIGAASVTETAPAPGSRVLDVCCGAGSSALPAAAAVGPDGQVDGIDLSGELLATGMRAAAEAGLANVRFIQADVRDWQREVAYDLVQSVFGVFFLPEMDAECDRLVGLLRPGGRFAVTTWARGALESVCEPFFDAAAEHGSELAAQQPISRQNSERLRSESDVAGWLRARGLTEVRARRHEFGVAVDADSAWQFLLSAAARARLHGMSSDEVERVRRSFVDRVRAGGVDTLHAPFVTGVGTKR